MMKTTLLLLVCLAVFIAADTNNYRGSGANNQAADLTKAISDFKAKIGGADNGGTSTTNTNGFRTINWDGAAVPTSPATFPGRIFANSDSTAATAGAVSRGLHLENPDATSNSFMVSRDTAPLQFGVAGFQAFSGNRVFTQLNSFFTIAHFYKPLTQQRAWSKAFGVVFVDVNDDDCFIEFYDINDNRRHTVTAEKRNDGLSFAGTVFDDDEGFYYVKIRSGGSKFNGTQFDGLSQTGSTVMDDFIYAEPFLKDDRYKIYTVESSSANTNSISPTITAFQNAIGGVLNPNTNVCVAQGAGYRSINWDAAALDADADPNNFKGDFFNQNNSTSRARGIVFSVANGNNRAMTVSATTGAQPVLFGRGTDLFTSFSSNRIFAPKNTNTHSVDFKLPCGTTTDAKVKALGIVYLNVRTPLIAHMKPFTDDDDDDTSNNEPNLHAVQTEAKGYSFVGIVYPTHSITHADVENGNARFTGTVTTSTGSTGGFETGTGKNSPVAVDDFIFGEMIRRDTAPSAPAPSPNTPSPNPSPNTPSPNPSPNTPSPNPSPNTPSPNPSPNTPSPQPSPNTPSPSPSPQPSPNTPSPSPSPNPSPNTPSPNPSPNTPSPSPSPNSPSPSPSPNSPSPSGSGPTPPSPSA